MKKILFIIGSLRKDSFNRKLAEEAEMASFQYGMVKICNRYGKWGFFRTDCGEVWPHSKGEYLQCLSIE